ncbi:DUF2946 family protein [Bradyrhizobium sp. HKCCYLS3077]|uniref:DUF2946 family protein n=1 Tax=unclassified Bradyrhizobium TaxID=2631580 RepID=UPI003EBD549F
MRQRLQAFFPIVLIALMVQILAPIGFAWATAANASDPLRGVEICHSRAGSQPADNEPSGKLGHSACALCCTVQPVVFEGPAPIRADLPQREARVVVWRSMAADIRAALASSSARARAPPAA